MAVNLSPSLACNLVKEKMLSHGTVGAIIVCVCVCYLGRCAEDK